MGLIKAGLGALSGTMADQWKEFFYCESIDNDVLAVKGQKVFCPHLCASTGGEMTLEP